MERWKMLKNMMSIQLLSTHEFAGAPVIQATRAVATGQGGIGALHPFVGT